MPTDCFTKAVRTFLTCAVLAVLPVTALAADEAPAAAQKSDAKADSKTAKAKSGANSKKEADKASPKKKTKIARALPDYAYIVPDRSQFLGGFDKGFLEGIAAKLRHKRGVKRAEVMPNNEIRLEVISKQFNSENLIAGLDGFSIEMRVPYERVEIHFVEGGAFPPKMNLTDDNVLVVETSTELRNAIGNVFGFNLPLKMRCIGKVNTSRSNEIVLARFETEKIPLSKMVPFMAVGDFDGDRKSDIFMRIKGMPDFMAIQSPEGFRVIPMTQPPADLKTVPRCEQQMENYVHNVPKKKVKCQDEADVPQGFKGDAVESVTYSAPSKLMLWDGKRPRTCSPMSEAVMPLDNLFGGEENNGEN